MYYVFFLIKTRYDPLFARNNDQNNAISSKTNKMIEILSDKSVLYQAHFSVEEKTSLVWLP